MNPLPQFGDRPIFPMPYCFRLLLAAYMICFSIVSVSIAGGLDQPFPTRAAIAETQADHTRAGRSVESVKSSDWARWLWALVPLVVASSVIAVKSQASKKARINKALSDPKHDPSGMALLNEIREDRSPESPLNTTTRLAKANIVETLMTDLHSRDADKRRQGIWELGQRGDSRAIQPLVDLLTDSDSMQRSLILAAVSEIAVRSLKPMNRALMLALQDESPDVRKNAIRDVTRIYDAMAQMNQLLHYAASDTDAEVQDTAHWALNQMNQIPLPEALPSSLQIKSGKRSGESYEDSPEDPKLENPNPEDPNSQL